jgi:hypothetical protein
LQKKPIFEQRERGAYPAILSAALGHGKTQSSDMREAIGPECVIRAFYGRIGRNLKISAILYVMQYVATFSIFHYSSRIEISCLNCAFASIFYSLRRLL